jgi:hypothetical protein
MVFSDKSLILDNLKEVSWEKDVVNGEEIEGDCLSWKDIGNKKKEESGHSENEN